MRIGQVPNIPNLGPRTGGLPTVGELVASLPSPPIIVARTVIRTISGLNSEIMLD